MNQLASRSDTPPEDMASRKPNGESRYGAAVIVDISLCGDLPRRDATDSMAGVRCFIYLFWRRKGYHIPIKLSSSAPPRTTTMPSDQSTWLIAIPSDGDAEGILPEIIYKLAQVSRSPQAAVTEFTIPAFKVDRPFTHPHTAHAAPNSQTGTLDSLITLSEELPKQDAFFTSTVAKTVDTLRNLLNNDPAKLAQHILVNERSVDDYILKGWRWNEGRYGVQRSLRDTVDALNKVISRASTPPTPPHSYVVAACRSRV